LQWSGLYYDEELIDELWKIKYLEHKNYKYSQETTWEMIKIVGKCNVSESIWSSLLDWIEKYQLDLLEKHILLLNAVQSYASNIPKVTEMILRKYGRQMWSSEKFVHMGAASNEGNWAAEIMQVLLKYSSNHLGRQLGFDSVGLTSLLHAVLNESESGPKVVKLLLEKNIDPNSPYFDEEFTLVHFAASNQGDYAADILKQLLEKGGVCEVCTNIDQCEPIHLATMNYGGSALKLFDLLLNERGMNVIHEGSGRSLIHFATMNCGDCGPQILKKLLENGAEVNAIDNNKQTALHLVAKDSLYETNQDILLMKILLENSGDPNAADQHGRTPVHFAASSLSGEHAHEKLKLLLDHGGILTSKESNGFNPVHYTLLNMGICGAKMRELIGVNRESANVPLDSDSGKTLLHVIVSQKKVQLPTLSDPSKYNRKVDLVQLILDNGGNPNAKDKNGQSPVHIAVLLGGSYDGLIILQRLLQKGGDPNLIDIKEQQTPVHYATDSARKAAPELMKILLENGGNANKSDGKQGLTPLHVAANNSGIHGHKLTTLLLEYGGNPNTTDPRKCTPLHFAIINKNDQLRLDIIKQLLEKGGNANAGDKAGLTPVHYIIRDKRSNSLEVLKLLLKHGGNILQENHRGLTPHRLATQRGNEEYCLPEVKKLIERTYRKMK
jgi:ankyrin repeat protein